MNQCELYRKNIEVAVVTKNIRNCFIVCILVLYFTIEFTLSIFNLTIVIIFKGKFLYLNRTKMTNQTEDYLEVDPPIPGQSFVCLSFVSPEDMIRKKTVFESRKFLESVIARVKSTDPEDKNKLTLEEAVAELTVEKFLDYNVMHEEENNKQFNEENEFTTSTRGIKVRGVFESLKEAQRKAKVLQNRDPTFHVFVGQVGYWLPWDPNPDNIENQEYAEQHLNEIVKKYKENRQTKDQVWNADLQKRIQATKEEGQRGAIEAGAAAAAAGASATVDTTPSIKEITESGVTSGAELKAEESKQMVDNMFNGDSGDLFLSRKTEQ